MKSKTVYIAMLLALIFLLLLNGWLLTDRMRYANQYRKVMLTNDSLLSVNLLLTRGFKNHIHPPEAFSFRSNTFDPGHGAEIEVVSPQASPQPINRGYPNKRPRCAGNLK